MSAQFKLIATWRGKSKGVPNHQQHFHTDSIRHALAKMDQLIGTANCVRVECYTLIEVREKVERWPTLSLP